MYLSTGVTQLVRLPHIRRNLAGLSEKQFEPFDGICLIDSTVTPGSNFVLSIGEKRGTFPLVRIAAINPVGNNLNVSWLGGMGECNTRIAKEVSSTSKNIGGVGRSQRGSKVDADNHR